MRRLAIVLLAVVVIVNVVGVMVYGSGESWRNAARGVAAVCALAAVACLCVKRPR